MSIEVLLMSDVEGLGTEGSLVKVSDGYARNMLFPRKLAAPVSEATKRRLEKIRKQREAEEKEKIDSIRSLSAKIKAVSLTMSAKVQEGTAIFGSIGSADIVAALEKQGIKLDKKSVVLDDPIKELGTFDVKINLGAGIESSVKVWVVEE